MSGAKITKKSERNAPLGVVGEAVTVLRAPGGDHFAAFLQEGPAQVGPPPHKHDWDEAFFVIEGEVEFMTEGEIHLLEPGDFVNIPAGTVHSFRNRKESKMLSMTSRSNPAAFFEEVSNEVTTLPPEIPKLLAVAERHALEFQPPA